MLVSNRPHNRPHLLVDVRTPVELDLCQLPKDVIHICQCSSRHHLFMFSEIQRDVSQQPSS